MHPWWFQASDSLFLLTLLPAHRSVVVMEKAPLKRIGSFLTWNVDVRLCMKCGQIHPLMRVTVRKDKRCAKQIRGALLSLRANGGEGICDASHVKMNEYLSSEVCDEQTICCRTAMAAAIACLRLVMHSNSKGPTGFASHMEHRMHT